MTGNAVQRQLFRQMPLNIGRQLTNDCLMLGIVKFKDLIKKLVQQIGKPSVQLLKILQAFQLKYAAVTQSENGIDFCAAVRGCTGHQGNQLTNTQFEQRQIRADYGIQFDENLVEQLTGFLLAAGANKLL